MPQPTGSLMQALSPLSPPKDLDSLVFLRSWTGCISSSVILMPAACSIGFACMIPTSLIGTLISSGPGKSVPNHCITQLCSGWRELSRVC
ncbi:hypothetical protein BDW60DRAFT_187965 [Aspergillus nidulans var. acristatus]